MGRILKTYDYINRVVIMLPLTVYEGEPAVVDADGPAEQGRRYHDPPEEELLPARRTRTSASPMGSNMRKGSARTIKSYHVIKATRIGCLSLTNCLDDPAEIQVGFTLEKPVSFLAAHMDRIGSDIFEEIGVPNSKVSIVSMHSLASKYSTRVVFGVLPYPKDASISLPALSVLRSSLIGMMLKQLNLSLTPSIFGYPSSIELLGFPGGITVVPAQSGSIWASTDPLFNFVLNNSIGQILGNLTELKNQLEFGLNLRSYERIYLQFRNEIGSSVEAPATIEASVLDGTSILLPYRLKQLAELIKEPDARNLGLNHSVFGKCLIFDIPFLHGRNEVAQQPSLLQLLHLRIFSAPG
ncbi:hypothetical protein TRIUR3_05821 [Triticum urartu]|uniref:DUF7036 domain-containing protein n=1 Tax=Triticum urartu TaxID=4572 RepID=M8A2C1_TRIUA|nr:hypothetical protein TRIUR3_05821 [Triticum urartu]